MDSDLSHDPRDLRRLLAALDAGADVALGSRYHGGIRVVDWSLFRLLISVGAGYYTRWLTGLPLADPTSGFKALRRDALAGVSWDEIAADGYGFQIALHFSLVRSGRRVVEVPIVFTERRSGQSKFSTAVVIEAALLVPRLALRRLTRQR
jgi:dolichol-phosphate mannosyltransferase